MLIKKYIYIKIRVYYKSSNSSRLRIFKEIKRDSHLPNSREDEDKFWHVIKIII